MATKTFRTKAKIENYAECASFLEENLEMAGFDLKSIIKILTACEEIIVNVMNYAYPDGDGDLIIALDDSQDCIKITFKDHGQPFNPLEKKDVDISLSAEEREIGGLGIHMVKQLMDDVKYDYLEGQNVLTIIKKL